MSHRSSTATKPTTTKPTGKRSARKAARSTKVAAPRAAVTDTPHARWVAAAMHVADDTNPLNVPYDVFLDEARNTAGFLRKRWRPEGTLPGLERVRNRLPESTADEIAELIEATQAAHTDATLAVTSEAPSDAPRAVELITRLAAALDFSLGDGDPEGDDLKRLTKVREFHADAGSRNAALGQDLRNHATLADSVRARLVHDDAGFDVALIDEALVLASRLTRPSLAPDAADVGDAPMTGGIALRNRLLRLLVERVSRVRRCARHVFAAHPDVLQEVTSAYERERRARARKARAEEDDDTPADDAPTG